MTSEDWVKVLAEDGSEAALLAYCDWLSDQEGWEDAAETARGLPWSPKCGKRSTSI